MATTPPSTGRGPLPGHVAWVVGPVVAGPSCGTPEREEHALRALVDSALELCIGWLTIQDPSCGRALREHARELADRGVALADAARPSSGGSGGPESVVHVESPVLQVLLAGERSGRREIVAAVQELAARGVKPDDVHERTIGEALGVPDVDLLVLTGGVRRVPDLLVWQVAYSEIVVIDDPWPEVGEEPLRAAVVEYQGRDRRYGGLVAPR